MPFVCLRLASDQKSEHDHEYAGAAELGRGPDKRRDHAVHWAAALRPYRLSPWNSADSSARLPGNESTSIAIPGYTSPQSVN